MSRRFIREWRYAALDRRSRYQIFRGFPDVSGPGECGDDSATTEVTELECVRRTVRQIRQERVPIETDTDRRSDAPPRGARVHGALSSRTQPSRAREPTDHTAPRSRVKIRAHRSSHPPRWNAELLRTSGGVIASEFLNRTGFRKPPSLNHATVPTRSALGRSVDQSIGYLRSTAVR
jgi:hypothetical protein